MNNRNRVSRGQLAASASAVVAFFGGYGQAFGQAANCALQSDGTTYICSGAATTTQTITLSVTASTITTAPGFSVNTPDGGATVNPDAILIRGGGSFIDNNQSSISGMRGIDFVGSGPITITTNGTVTGRRDQGILAQINNGGIGELSITAANISGAFGGISATNNGSGGISITTSGTVTGGTNGGGISATVGAQSTGDISIRAVDVNGNITANNYGSGGVSLTTSGTSGKIEGVRAFAAGAGAVTLDVTGPVEGPLNAYSNTGNISITASGAESGAGIHAISNTGAVSIYLASSGSASQIEGQIDKGGALSITVDGAVSGHVGMINGRLGGGTGDASITISRGASVGSGIFAESYGPGHTVITVNGTVNGDADPTTGHSNGIAVATSSDAASTTDIAITSTGKVEGAVTVNSQQFLGREFDQPATSYGPAVITNAGSIGGILSKARTTVTNNGTISTRSGENAIELAAPGSVVNLQGGSVTGEILFTQPGLDAGADTLTWSGGALAGGITFGDDNVAAAGKGVVTANLTGLSLADLSGTTHIRSSSDDSTLNLSHLALRGGSFGGDDPTRGVNLAWRIGGESGTLQGWKTINLSDGATLELTGDLIAQNISIGAGSAIRIAASSPLITGDIVNGGTLDLSGTGTVGNVIGTRNSFTQSATGNLIVGVTPTQIDVLNVGTDAKLAGTVTFAWGPGTYVAGSRPFLTTGYGTVTGAFSNIASASGTSAPSGLDVTVAYAQQNASLVLTEASTTEPQPPVVVAPVDGALFGEQIAGFITGNELRAVGLLGRAQPDGGGSSFFNPDIGEPRPGRFWFEGTGHTLDAGFRASAAGVQAGGDATVGKSGRIGVALAYERSWVDDDTGGNGHGNALHASVYASQPLGPIGISAVFTYSRAWDVSRRPTGAGTANSKRDLTGLTGGAQLSAPIAARGALLTPAVGVLVSYLKADAFQETGGGLPGFAVDGLSASKTFVSPFASLGFSYALMSRNGVTWVPDAEIGYRRSAAAEGLDTILVSDDGTSFADNRAVLDRDVVTVGASLSAHKGHWTGFIKYRAQVAEGWTDHSGAIGLRIAF